MESFPTLKVYTSGDRWVSVLTFKIYLWKKKSLLLLSLKTLDTIHITSTYSVGAGSYKLLREKEIRTLPLTGKSVRKLGAMFSICHNGAAGFCILCNSLQWRTVLSTWVHTDFAHSRCLINIWEDTSWILLSEVRCDTATVNSQRNAPSYVVGARV